MRLLVILCHGAFRKDPLHFSENKCPSEHDTGIPFAIVCSEKQVQHHTVYCKHNRKGHTFVTGMNVLCGGWVTNGCRTAMVHSHRQMAHIKEIFHTSVRFRLVIISCFCTRNIGSHLQGTRVQRTPVTARIILRHQTH